MGFFNRASKLSASKSFDSFSTSDEKEGSPRKIPGKDADFGTQATVKTFYEGKNSCPGHYDWVDSPPKQLASKIAKQHDRVAIKIFKIKDHSQETVTGKTPLKIHSIELQSPLLVAALKDIVKEENVFLESTETAKFQEPFKPLFFRYDAILALFKNEKQGILKNHLKLLVSVMNDIFSTTFAKLANMKKSGLISYKLAWTYFPRGTVMFSGTQDCTRVVRVVDTAYTSDDDGHRMSIEAEEIAFNGEKFEWRSITLKIPAFAGNLPIDALPCFPLEFHSEKGAVKERLTERAEKVLGYQDLQYREYEGVGLLINNCRVKKHNVNGRILVDYLGYQKYHEGLVRTEAQNTPPPPPPPAPGYPPSPPSMYNRDEKKEKKGITYVKALSLEKQQENVEAMLNRPQDLIFVSPILQGFSLKSKLWLNFYVDDMKPVTWNDDAYSHLVYPESQKDLVLTFVSNHQRLKTGMDDVIMGKGQGLILLLSGPPGTGKTLTAEAVADKTRRPLYYLQAEDLGTNAAVLGPKIKKVFEMATEWNAVILLDEADVFMAERSPADIARNELVSIFLRELEYFQGIIFLTTNLYSTIDTAFRSRVNIHLLFEPLKPDARKVLWEKFLKRLPSLGGEAEREEIGDDVMGELAKWELNGREIKNAVKTVRTWCICKGFGINLERLEAGIKVTAPQAKKVEY